MTKKKSQKKEKSSKSSTAIVVRQETALSRGEREEIARELKSRLGRSGRKRAQREAITEDFRRAAAILAPHFAITNWLPEKEGAASVQTTEVLTEILCSAGAWLALARGVSKDELLAEFEKWANEQGYAE